MLKYFSYCLTFLFLFFSPLYALQNLDDLSRDIEQFTISSAADLYNLNDVAMKVKTKAFFQSDRVKGVHVQNIYTGETFFKAYKSEKNLLVFNESIPENIIDLRSKKLELIYDGSIIGTVTIYYEYEEKVKGLSVEEKAWLEEHPILRVGNEPDYAPWDFNIDDTPMGYSIDFVNLLAAKLDLKLEYTLDTWGNLTNKLSNKELDLLHTMFQNDTRKGISYSDPYKTVINALFVNEKNKDIKSLDDLETKIVCVTKGDSTIASLREKFPNINIIEVDGYIEAIKNVALNKADATIVELGVANHLIREYSIPSIKIIDEVDFAKSKIDYKFRFGVRDDYQILTSILNKAMQSVSQDELDELENRWLNISKSTNQKKQDSKQLKVAFGYGRVPFVYGITSAKGIEIDLVKKAFEAVGYSLEIEQMNKSAQMSILKDNKEFDASASIPKEENSGLFYSDDLLSYDNVVITRKSDKIKINSEEDLLGKKVVAWDMAYQVLTPKYRELFNPQSTWIKDDYREVEDQREQHELFFSKKANVIICDKTVFEFQQNQLKNKYDVFQEYDIHPIFSKKTSYTVAFKDKTLRDILNEGLKTIKQNGKYDAVVKFYVEGDVGLQLKIVDIIANIASKYIYDGDIQGLKKVLEPFVQLDYLHDIDIYDGVSKTRLVHVEKESHHEENFSNIEKELFYIKSGNPIKLGRIELSFIDEKIKTLGELLLPDIQSFTFLSSDEFKRLEDIYKTVYKSSQLLNLTQEEKEWIKKHTTVTFTGDPDWLPFESFDKHGNYYGIVADHLKVIEERTGIEFKKIKPDSWNDALQKVKNNEVDIISEVVSENTVSESMQYTTPYIETPLIVVAQKNENTHFISDLSEIKEKKIAYVSGYGYVWDLTKKYPDIKFYEVNTIQEGLEKVASGELDSMVCTLTIGTYNISKLGLSNLVVVGKLDIVMKLGLGVRKDWPLLLSILNKALNSITLEEKSNITKKWVDVTLEEKTDWEMLLKIAGLGFLLFAFIVYNNRKLKKLVDEKTAQLQTLLSSFDKNVIASSTDTNGVITYVSDSFCEISGYSREELIGKTHRVVKHSDMPKEIYEDLWNTIKAGKVWKGEIKNKTKLGTFYWVESIITPEFDTKENLIGYSAIRQDITDKKAVEALSEQQATQMQEIERSNRLLNGRENRMVALKQELNEYKLRLGEESLYTLIDVDDITTDETLELENKDESDLRILLDVEQLQSMMESFYKIMKIPLAIIDLEANILVSSKWQRSCTDFHRANEESCKRCIASDMGIANELEEGKNFTSYKCSNGLIDCASPIIIHGEHVANFFIGQFLIEEPDMEFFTDQAKFFGYDLEDYLDSIRDIPVIKEDKLPFILGFLTEITSVVTSISIERIKAQKNENINKMRAIEMQKGQIAAMNLAEDAEKARLEVENYKEHLEVLIQDRTKDLSESQERFRALFDSAPDGMNIIKDGLYVDCNQASLEIYGVATREEFLNSSPSKFGVEYQDNGVKSELVAKEKIQEATSNGSAKFEWKYKRFSTQEERYAEVIISPILLNGEEHIYSVVRDITEKKEMQKIVDDQKRFFQTLLDSQEQLIITTDGESLRTANETFFDFFAVDDVEEFMQAYAAKCVCDTFNTNAPEGYLQIRMGEEQRESWIDYVISRPFEHNHKAMISRDGHDFIFSVSAAKLPGDVGLKSAVFTDITEMENAKIEIEKKQTMMRSLVDAIPSVIFMKDKDGKHLLVNKFYSEATGISHDQVIGKTDFEVMLPEVANAIMEKDSMVLSSGKSLTYEENVPNLEGQIRDYVTSKVPLIDKNDLVYGMVGIATDITKTKELQREIEATHKHTRESIEYASLIQRALIPDNTAFRNYFSEYFAIWQPKDTIGGDIYLFEELRDSDECLLMVIDCTGHGVPGAFVTMLVKAIERQIVGKINTDPNIDVSPAWILSYFNRKMKTLLKQHTKDSISNAGFDGGLIYYNKKEKLLKFSGAETALFYMQEDELKTIKGNRHSIGYKTSDIDYEFTDHIIETNEDMQFYCTTDGYIDQNGGEKGFPFAKKKFKKLIEEYHQENMANQEEIFLKELENYQGEEERNDDVTLIGFKI